MKVSTSLRLVVFVVPMFLLLGSAGHAQFCSPVNCSGGVGLGMNCTVMGTVPACPGSYPTEISQNTIPSGTVSAACSNMTLNDFKGTGTHAVGVGPNAGTQANCIILFSRGCSNGTRSIGTTQMCPITAANGLPVELMGFSIESDTGAAGEGADVRDE